MYGVGPISVYIVIGITVMVSVCTSLCWSCKVVARQRDFLLFKDPCFVPV